MRLPDERQTTVWRRLRAHDIEELWDHSINPHVAASYAARLALVEDLVRSACPAPGKVVDVGCAQGTLGLRLAEEGYSVTLIDAQQEALEYARQRWERGAVEFVTGHAKDVAGAGRQFDAAICTEVLEHVREPADLLGELALLVRRGGSLVLTTPNADYALARMPSFGAAHQDVIDDALPDSMDGDAHRYLFTKEELVALARGVGLSVQRAGFALPFWLQGHLKTRAFHRLHYRLRGRIVALPHGRIIGHGALARHTCSCLWLVATRK